MQRKGSILSLFSDEVLRYSGAGGWEQGGPGEGGGGERGGGHTEGVGLGKSRQYLTAG